MKILTAEFARPVHTPSDFPRDGRPEIAFVGRSNVGKSSLMNRMLGRKGLARISSTPGRTRAVNYFLVNDRFYFVDLPGYGYARAAKQDREVWARLIESYFQRDEPQEAAARRSVVLLVDGKVGATDLDVQALEWLLHLGVDVLVVATKIDRIARGKRAGQLETIRRKLGMPPGVTPLPVSAKTGEGMKDLWREVELRL